jgi:hypothetical protein
MALSKIKFVDKVGLDIVKAKDHLRDGMPLKGTFKIEHWRAGVKINEFEIDNLITVEAKNFLLNLAFHGASGPAKINTWYIGLVDNAGFTAFDETDTYDDIDQAGNGWDEWQDYTDANNGDSTTTRPQWSEAAASSKSITTDTPQAIYDVVAAGDGDTVKGVFICGGTNAQTKGDHTAGSPPNILWSMVAFSATVGVQTSDQLKVTYTLSC